MKRIFTLAICYLIFGLNINGQTPGAEKDTIQQQFNRLIQESNDYRGFKMVDYNELINLRNSTVNYISDLQDKITTQENLIKEQKEQIASLKAELEQAQKRIENLESEKEIIRFIGIPLQRQTYNTTVWLIILALVFVSAFFLFRYRKSKLDMEEAKANLQQTEREFEAHRSKALEKEQRLGRLLQDERNKTSGK